MMRVFFSDALNYDFASPVSLELYPVTQDTACFQLRKLACAASMSRALYELRQQISPEPVAMLYVIEHLGCLRHRTVAAILQTLFPELDSEDPQDMRTLAAATDNPRKHAEVVSLANRPTTYKLQPGDLVVQYSQHNDLCLLMFLHHALTPNKKE